MSGRSKSCWAIVNKGCAYNTASRRTDAIAYHVHWHVPASEAAKSAFAYATLDSDQRAAWALCLKRGDRAVKATLSWSEQKAPRR